MKYGFEKLYRKGRYYLATHTLSHLLDVILANSTQTQNHIVMLKVKRTDVHSLEDVNKATCLKLQLQNKSEILKLKVRETSLFHKGSQHESNIER